MATPQIKPAEVLQFDALDAFDASEKMNEQFLELEWGDGFPLVPPTQQKVKRMLEGTTRNPHDLITVLTPGAASLP